MNEPVSNSVEILLRNQRKGRFLTDLSEAMQQAANAAREHGKPAKLTITFNLVPANGDATAMSVADEIRIKMPEANKPSSLFFVTDDGRLVRDDPNQAEMNLQISQPQPQATQPVAATA